jgi:hypothetical protein
MRHSDPTLPWPPPGITLEIDFIAPQSAIAAHQDVVVTVVYTMYDNLPLYEKHIVITSPTSKVMIDTLVMDQLYVTNEAAGYWGHPMYGSLTSDSISGRVHVETELSRGGTTVQFTGDARCTTCTQGNSGDLVIESSYPLGPGAQVGPEGFHGDNFSSIHT